MIPFNKPFLTGDEIKYISEAHSLGQLAGDGKFTKLCSLWLEQRTSCIKALLTNSCTAALEMSAILVDIQPGDEIIMPSYTFVSTANAFVLRGAVPVFVDIRPDTLNIDESLIEAAITKKTKAIVPVHYAGVSCEMDTIMEIAKKYKLFVIEDAAQGVLASYKGKPLGSIGHLGCYSFHETKNIISGEGGALLINDPSLVERAEFIRQKGTNRSKFFQGKVDKYTWVDIGSSYLPSEITAAFLWAQMQKADYINSLRVSIWDRYHSSLARFDKLGLLFRPTVPDYVQHNAHMYYLLLPDLLNRARFIAEMNKYNINCVFHYIPLHSSPAGMLYGRTNEPLKITDIQSFRLVRLPLYLDLCKTQQDHILFTIEKLLL